MALRRPVVRPVVRRVERRDPGGGRLSSVIGRPHPRSALPRFCSLRLRVLAIRPQPNEMMLTKAVCSS